PSQQAQLTKRYTSNPIAYEFYLKGAYTFDQRISPDSAPIESAISLHKKAIEADPNFALAHAQLAYCYAVMAVVFWPTLPTLVERAEGEINCPQEIHPPPAGNPLAPFSL